MRRRGSDAQSPARAARAARAAGLLPAAQVKLSFLQRAACSVRSSRLMALAAGPHGPKTLGHEPSRGPLGQPALALAPLAQLVTA